MLAEAGIQKTPEYWIPAFAGITAKKLSKLAKIKNPAVLPGRGFEMHENTSARNDAYCSTAARTLNFKKDAAIDLGKQSVILTDADIHARIKFGAALTHNNITSQNLFTGITLNAQSLRMRIATVTRTTTCFFMCHE